MATTNKHGGHRWRAPIRIRGVIDFTGGVPQSAAAGKYESVRARKLMRARGRELLQDV